MRNNDMKSRKKSSFILHLSSLFLFLFSLLFFTACTSATESTTPLPVPTSQKLEINPLFADNAEIENSEEQVTETTTTPLAQENMPESTSDNIVIDLAAETKPFNNALLGTNVPAWLGRGVTTDATFIERTKASGTSMLRIPGGSWANYYEWLPCEQENACPWDWGVLTPTDFINFINATEIEAMYTINMNGTAQEAAALVAFFNGTIEDETVIGVDVHGYDWGTVSQWAQLRTEHGNPNPVGIRHWEVGNESFAGKTGMGTDCVYDWGWEDVWTCDGTEYVTGIGEGDTRRDGFLDYVVAMKAVDPSILVGAVGFSPENEWSDWGTKVITAAGDVMDFYIIHEYGFFDPPRNNETILAHPQAVWGPMKLAIQNAFDRYGNGRFPPIAITEYNLFSWQDADNHQLMTRTVNMLYLADTIGQMATHGFAIANQWNLANGQAENGTDYGILHTESYERYPSYYVFPMWSQFGTSLLPVTSPFANDTTLSTYASTKDDGTLTLLAINKTGNSISTAIQILNNPASFTTASATVVQADSLDSQTVTFNGNPNPANNLSDAPPTILDAVENPLSYTFAPYSITLLEFSQ